MYKLKSNLMKTKLLLLVAIVLSFSFMINAQDMAENAVSVYHSEVVFTTVEWDKVISDFGSIKKNKPVTAEFIFKNVGNKPLIISKVGASCGCTATNYSNEPLLPGQSSRIEATYNARSTGAFTKTITVYSNDKAGEKRLKIKGIVVEN